MVICVDIGNTHIVMGIFSGNDLVHCFRMKTDGLITEDEYAIKIHNVLRIANLAVDDIQGAIIASVVPSMDLIWRKLFEKYFTFKPIFVAPGIRSGLNIKLDNPKELGADLLVGGVAAMTKYGAPVIVIDLGTATTLTVVSEKKEFLGGIIIPGVMSSASSLIKATSRLEETSFARPERLIGRSTSQSIQSGMVYGTASMLDGLIAKTKDEIGAAKVVVTGGIAKYIIKYLQSEVILDDNLVIDGLKILYDKNK